MEEFVEEKCCERFAFYLTRSEKLALEKSAETLNCSLGGAVRFAIRKAFSEQHKDAKRMAVKLLEKNN